jgi:hypothetical protein
VTPVDVDARVAELYGGPLDAFTAGRDALARELRAAGLRDEAAEVKALRKPKAVAWALDAGALAAPGAVEALAAAVGSMSGAQEGGGDVRAAIAEVRAAEGDLVAAAHAAASGHGRSVDRAVLAAAVRAIVSDPASLDALRAGRLEDTPASGGLGFADPGGGGPAPAPRSAPPARPAAPARPARERPGRKEAPAPSPPPRPRARPDPGARAEARRAVEAADKAARAAARAARAAGDEARLAEDEAEAAERHAATARRRADDARATADAARSRADELTAAAGEAAADLDAAREARRALDHG